MAQCLECIRTSGTSKEFKSLVPHLKQHVLSVADYRDKYGDSVDIGYVIDQGTNPHKPKTTGEIVDDIVDSVVIPDLDPNEVVTEGLHNSERNFFRTRYDYLMKMIDDDRALESQIRDIVMGEITIARYQKELARITGSLHTAAGMKKLGDAKQLQTLIKELRKSNLDDIKALSLTREQKQAQRKSPETTPSRLMARYAQYIAALSPEQLARQREDELEAATRFQVNLRKLQDIVPSDLVATKEVVEEESDE